MTATIAIPEIRMKLFPKQKEFVLDQHRHSVYSGGFGCGKSYSGVVKAILIALQNPKSEGIIGTKHFTHLRDTTMAIFEKFINE